MGAVWCEPVVRAAVADPRYEAAMQVDCSPVHGLVSAGDRGVHGDDVSRWQIVSHRDLHRLALLGHDYAPEVAMHAAVRGICVAPQLRGLQTRMQLVRVLSSDKRIVID